jgi:hypothetical protein
LKRRPDKEGKAKIKGSQILPESQPNREEALDT